MHGTIYRRSNVIQWSITTRQLKTLHQKEDGQRTDSMRAWIFCSDVHKSIERHAENLWRIKIEVSKNLEMCLLVIEYISTPSQCKLKVVASLNNSAAVEHVIGSCADETTAAYSWRRNRRFSMIGHSITRSRIWLMQNVAHLRWDVWWH